MPPRRHSVICPRPQKRLERRKMAFPSILAGIPAPVVNVPAHNEKKPLPCGEQLLVLLSGQPGWCSLTVSGQGQGRVSPLPWPVFVVSRSIHPMRGCVNKGERLRKKFRKRYTPCAGVSTRWWGPRPQPLDFVRPPARGTPARTPRQPMATPGLCRHTQGSGEGQPRSRPSPREGKTTTLQALAFAALVV